MSVTPSYTITATPIIDGSGTTWSVPIIETFADGSTASIIVAIYMPQSWHDILQACSNRLQSDGMGLAQQAVNATLLATVSTYVGIPQTGG